LFRVDERLTDQAPEIQLSGGSAKKEIPMTGWLRLGLALAVLTAAGTLSGCAKQVASSARIDPRAGETLRGMSDVLRSAGSLSFRATTTADELLASGRLAQFSRETRIVLRRPDRLFAEIHRGEDVWLIWYAGRNLTVLDRKANTYASVQVPGRIDDMLDFLADKYDLAMPLADLLFADPYKVLTAEVLTGQFVGIHEMNDAECTHLLFTQDNVDWQVWIAAGKSPLPKKVLIDYKNLSGRPQFAAVLSDWNLSAAAGDDQFKPTLPKEATKAELAQMLKTQQEKQ
jgi:hypothetical protein